MIKHFCDVCGVDITGCQSHTVKLGSCLDFNQEYADICNECVIALRAAVRAMIESRRNKAAHPCAEHEGKEVRMDSSKAPSLEEVAADFQTYCGAQMSCQGCRLYSETIPCAMRFAWEIFTARKEDE